MSAGVKHLTLVMLQSGNRILLGMKKRGFGAGKINVRSVSIAFNSSELNIYPGVWWQS
jgi:hypothetical protein